MSHRSGCVSGEDGLPDIEMSKEWLDSMFSEFEKDYDAYSIARFKNIGFDQGSSPLSYASLAQSEFNKVSFSPLSITDAPRRVFIGYGETIPVMEEIAGESDGVIGLLSVHPYPIHLINGLNNLGVSELVVFENNRGTNKHSEQGQLASKLRQYFNGKTEVVTQYDGSPMYSDVVIRSEKLVRR